MSDFDGASGGGAIGDTSGGVTGAGASGGGAIGDTSGGGAGAGASGGGAGGGASGGKTCIFIRNPSKGRNIRRRAAAASPTSDDDAPTLPSQKPKKTPTPDNKLHFSSARPTASSSSSSNPDPTLFRFESSSEIQVHHDSRATATLETETDFSNDARALRERSLKQSAASLTAKTNSADPKLYKGINNYTDYKAGFRRELTLASEKASGAHGPLRASAHIRMSARFDYQPDICKDYKETGYCGFGDACKFMHDRGDYKSGWQMDKEWEEKEKARKRKLAMKGGDDDEGEGGDDDDDDDEDEDRLPFACLICRQSFVDPVVTKCKHYFCEHCALKHHSKNKKCFTCNRPTLGIFNTAHEIKKRIQEK